MNYITDITERKNALKRIIPNVPISGGCHRL